ncbi:MAG: hypothetical protein HY898_01240 [Deltaproteobacteria bacterium]|nr:hypothetical protein [Deltaproteobacteria bacterium]
MNTRLVQAAVVGSLLAMLLSCGGSVEVGEGNDGGSEAGSGGSQNTGGKPGTGGTTGTGGIGGAGGVSGTGGQPGTGGSWGGYAGVAGASGIDGGGGGPAGSGASPCMPPPSCNWCNGAPKYDMNGCVVGYICKNGADPCYTNPCKMSYDCPPNETCGPDMLCWPSSIVTCSAKSCAGSSSGDCSCKWQCSDGNFYSYQCKPIGGGGTLCDCQVNGMGGMGCGTGGGGGSGGASACAAGSCCGYPE